MKRARLQASYLNVAIHGIAGTLLDGELLINGYLTWNLVDRYLYENPRT